MNRFILMLTMFLSMLPQFSTAVNLSDYVIVEPGSVIAGDLNDDKQVNAGDVSALYDEILKGGYSSLADLNADNQVNVGDVATLYGYILNGAPASGGSVLELVDYIDVDTDVRQYHEWVDGEAIFIELDGDAENVYAMVREGGRWVLRDVAGNNKHGFRTTGGTLTATYIQHPDLSNSTVNQIPINHGDVAFSVYTPTYTVDLRNNRFNITFDITFSHGNLSRVDIRGAKSGDYFYRVTHYEAVTSIGGKTTEKSTEAPVIDLDKEGGTGHAYGMWTAGTDYSNVLTFHYVTASNGYAHTMGFANTLMPAGYYRSIYAPGLNAWSRDLSMRCFNSDDQKNYKQKSLGSTSFNMNVGSQLSLRSYDGERIDTKGSITSASSSNTAVATVSVSQPEQVIVMAKKTGTTTVTVTHKTRDSKTSTYTFNITVKPTVWAAGSFTSNNVTKPMLWRNNYCRQSNLNTNLDDVSGMVAHNVAVHGDKAYVMIRKDNTISSFSNGTAMIARCTSANGGGYFTKYKSGLTGNSYTYCSTYLLRSIPRMCMSLAGDVYYTSSYIDPEKNYHTTQVYKNSTLLQTIPGYVVNDMAYDETTSRLYLAGMASDYHSTPAWEMKAHLAVIDNNNNISFYTKTCWMNLLAVDNGAVYILSETFYKGSYGYGWGTNYKFFMRYTPSGGLAMYAGTDNGNGLRLFSAGYYSDGKHYPFAVDNNTLYYATSYNASDYHYRPVRYEAGASASVVDESAVDQGWVLLQFTVKNGTLYGIGKKISGSEYAVIVSPANDLSQMTTTPLDLPVGTTDVSVRSICVQTSMTD